MKQAANDTAESVWVHNVTCQVLGEPVVVVPNSSSTKVFNRIQITSFGKTVYNGALDLRPTMNEIRANARSNGAHEYMNVDGLLPGPRGSSDNYTTYTVEVPGVENSPRQTSILNRRWYLV